jgi:histone-lysine N-methyltransferase SETMAR
MKMENLRFRAVIQFLTLEGKKPQEIFDRMGNVYGTSAPCYTTVKKWAAEFKRGRQSLEDDPRAGRPVEVTTHEMCEAVERVVLENRRVKVTEIAERINMSVGSVETIIHEHLGMRKVSARWVPRLLTPDMKHRRVECCQELLTRFENNFEDFKQRIVTGDETWLHCWDPDTKQESMQWKHVGSPPPRKARTQASAGKVMATIFWDTQGVILIDYLPQGSTITGTYYKNVLNQLRDALKQKRRGKLSRGILLLHDNAPSHSSRIAQAALDECGFEQLCHPPYSPDLAPSDFFLFRLLKKELRGTRFPDNNAVRQATEAWLDSRPQNFFLSGIETLLAKWTKCVSLAGDYIEK